MLEQALAKAMLFEKEIALFYLEEGVAPGNVLAQRLLLELAKQEIDHVLFVGQAAQAAVVPSATPSLEVEIKGFVQKMAPEALKKNASQVEALRSAREMEQNGLKMYREFVAAAGTPEEKAFFTSLLEQEVKHLESIDNVLLYLTGTGDWFEQDESKVWSWMNL